MQNSNDSSSRSPALLSTIGFVLAVLILIVGTVCTITIGNNVDERLRNDILIRAQNAALLLEPEEIIKLHADDRDLGNPAYVDLKDKMSDLIAVNPDARFFYLMGYDGANMFFFVDSEDALSEDYSPPGQKYLDAEPAEISNFMNGEDYVQGPYTDSWGRWISSSAHIKDAKGQVIAKLGIDVDAQRFQSELMFVRITILAITILLALLFGLFSLYARRSSQLINTLSGANATLSSSKSRLETASKMAHIGTFRWAPKSGFVVFDDGMYLLTKQKVDKKMTYEKFKKMLVQKDENIFDDLLTKADSENINNVSLEYTIYHPDGGTALIHSECVIERAGDGSVATILGTAQVK